MYATKNVRRLLLMSALIPAVLGCPGTPAAPETCPSDADTFQKMNAATYAVVLEFRVGPGANDLAYFALGTAFAIDERLMATNAHITEFFNELCGVEITGVLGVQSGTGEVVDLLRALTHPDYDGDPIASPDVGLLTSQQPLPVILDLATTGQLSDLGLGDDLLLAGFPGDVTAATGSIIPGETVPQATSLSGRITALRAHSTTEVVTAENTDVIQHQIPTTQGTSGSALVRCGRVAAINNAGTVQVIVTVDAAGNLVPDTTPAANNNFGVHAKYITEMVELFEAQTLQGFELPPEAFPCAGTDDSPQTGECGPGADPNCDFCWVTGNGTSCPEAWIGDGDCDCGCQFTDQQDCGGGNGNGGCQSNAECDDAVFCNGFEACVAGACQSGQPPCGGGMTCAEATRTCEAQSGCATDADCAAGETCVEGTCTAESPPPLETIVVGAWAGGAQCPGQEVAFAYFLCPQGRLRGAEDFGGFDFLVCGTWTVTQDDEIVLNYTATATPSGEVFTGETQTFQYQDGQLVWSIDVCPLPLQRLVGAVVEEDCTGGFCGGGAITGCGTDCDCGRCWYCENDTCRYGGEGEFGCFRGCPFE